MANVKIPNIANNIAINHAMNALKFVFLFEANLNISKFKINSLKMKLRLRRLSRWSTFKERELTTFLDTFSKTMDVMAAAKASQMNKNSSHVNAGVNCGFADKSL